MEDCWFYYSLSLTLCLTLISYLLVSSLRRPAINGKPMPITPSLPPGPPALMVLGPLVLLGWTNFGIELIFRTARSWYGRVFTIYYLSTPVIFVADRRVAHHVLVQRGAAFADRPPPNLTARIFSADQHTITSAAYGSLWRALRRNLSAKVLHPSRVHRHAAARRRAVSGLVEGIARQMRGEGVVVIEQLLHAAMFRVLVGMCFCDEAGGVVASVAALQREFLTSVVGFQMFGVFPVVTKVLFRRRWQRMLSIRRRQEELFVPLIRARAARRTAAAADIFKDECYADSLLGLRIPEDGDDGGERNLTESEMVCLCSELLASGTDSTVAVMQWAMANIVARPEIQAKLRAEIDHVVVDAAIGEEHLRRMPYLRAVMLEALRRHPPGRFMLPHAATEAAGATLDGFDVPRHAAVNFTLASMAWDEAVWPEPRQFRPERFLPGGEGEDVDLTGSREIKMMPFGAGRRVCPGIELALLHLEFFVANMVREFEWKEVPGEPVDFTERLEMSLVMKQPLRAIVVPRM